MFIKSYTSKYNNHVFRQKSTNDLYVEKRHITNLKILFPEYNPYAKYFTHLILGDLYSILAMLDS